MRTVAYVDAQAGCSGDMFLGALVDAGLPLAVLEEVVDGLGLEGVELRVTRVEPHEEDQVLDVQPGDLLLGMTVVREDANLVRYELVRFETLAALASGFDPLASREGNEVELWLQRGDAIQRVQAFVKRAKR